MRPGTARHRSRLVVRWTRVELHAHALDLELRPVQFLAQVNEVAIKSSSRRPRPSAPSSGSMRVLGIDLAWATDRTSGYRTRPGWLPSRVEG